MMKSYLFLCISTLSLCWFTQHVSSEEECAFANDPQDMTVKVNDTNIELRCQASDMLDTVWWEMFLRNGSQWTVTGSDEEVQRSRGLMFVSESTSLRILQVQAFHAGLYRCQGRRIFGTPPCVYFSENATITVQGPAKVVIANGPTFIVYTTQQLQISGTIDGEPDPNVTLSKLESERNVFMPINDPRIMIKLTETRLTIVIEDVQVKDTGIYRIMASNECGGNYTDFRIETQVCPRGTYLSPSNGSCSLCPANSVSEREGLSQCTCVDGYYRAPQGEEDLPCYPCPRGTYLSPSNGSCSACPANSVSENEGLSQCTCVDGYYRAPQGEEDLPCYLCPRGTYLSSSNGSCSVCPANSVSERKGLSQCTCVDGYYRAPQGEEDLPCYPCPRGTYLSPSSGSCSACPANSVSEREGLRQCTCVNGYYRAPQGEEDLPCYLSITNAPLVAIITVPTILLVLIAIATSIVVIIVIKINLRRKAQEDKQDYYSEVGPPPLPVRTKRNSCYQGAHTATTPEKENSLEDNKIKRATTTSENPAYGANELSVTTAENTAYRAIDKIQEVASSENLAYGVIENKLAVTTSENQAYGTNIAALSDDDDTDYY